MRSCLTSLALAFLLQSSSFAVELADAVAAVTPSLVHIRVVPNLQEMNDQKRKGTESLENIVRSNPSFGSGIIISDDGFIVTIANLVEDAGEVQVATHDGKKFQAKVVGRDKRSDVALLKIEASNLKGAPTADISKIRIGQQVFGAGLLPETFSFAPAVTNGIVSMVPSKGGDYLPMIQTTAQVSPGLGGGGLFNEKGELVGILSKIYRSRDSTQTLTFAVGIDEVLRVIPPLKQYSRVRRSGIGIRMIDINPEITQELELPFAGGVLVQEVDSGGPADKAGIQRGDIIVRIADAELKRAFDLPKTVGPIEPGSTIAVRYFRRGKFIDGQIVTREIEYKPDINNGSLK